MSKFFQNVGIGAATTVILSSSAAWAELTPQQVWDDWRAYMNGFGYEIEAQESSGDGALTVSDIVMTVPMPEEEGRATITFQEVIFSDSGNGDVAISIPSPLPIVIEGSGEEGSGKVTVDYVTEGYSMIASGTPDDVTYTYEAASMAMILGDVVSDGAPEEVGEARIDMTNVSGETRMQMGDLRQTVQAFTSGPVSYMFDFKDPEKGDRMQLAGEIESLALDAETAIPKSTDMTAFDEALEAGFAIDGTYRFGPGKMTADYDSQSEGEAFQYKSTSGGGSLGVTMDDSQLAYSIDYSDVTMDIASSELPFPVALASEELGLQLALPISKGEEPQDFQLGLLLGDFTMSEFIWSIFDAEGKLPRDPATVAVDLSGKATLNADLMDPEAMESENVPGEVNEVSINDLRISLAGAELTGAGEVELDNTDMTTYDGMPKPVGIINLTLEGGNALIDRLVEIGIVPEDQAMVARMTMGMFMVPTGDDSLESKLEFTEDGQMLANGQRLK